MILALAASLLLAAQTPAPDTEEQREAQALVHSVGTSVETLRGLKFKRPVAVRLVSPEEARAYFVERARKLWPPEKVSVDQAVYVQLGLVPAGTDLLKLFLDLLEEQARGFYDPGSDTFFLVRGLESDTLRVIMAHELTHALDDQYHDIDALAEHAADDDTSTALAAVVEGSGTLVMSAYLLEEVKAGRLSVDALVKLQKTEAVNTGRLTAAPAYIQRSLVAPYTLGMSFLLRGNLLGLVTGVQPADIERAFEHPPTSTEQILHPEKYWDDAQRDPPGNLKLSDLSAVLGKGYTLAGQGSLGELGLAVLTGARMPDPQSAEAAMAASWTTVSTTGWQGDRYQYYAHGTEGVTVLATRWDSDEEAGRFHAALVGVSGRRSYRYGPAVVLVAGAPDALADELAPLVLSAVVRP